MSVLDSLLKFSPPDQYLQELVSAPRFNFTNVAKFFYEDKKEHWTTKDILYPHPPFNKLWFEMKMPRDCFSEEVGKTQLELPGYEIYSCGVATREDDIFVLSGSHIIFPEHGADREKPVHITERFLLAYSIDKEGYPKVIECKSKDIWYFFAPVLLGFSFSACRNIEIIRVEVSPALNKARVRKDKPPIRPYHVINILPFGQVVRQQRRTVVSDDGKIDIQIRRGVYAKYGPKFDRGLLFGKYEGIFWKPPILGDKTQEYKIEAK